LPHKLQEKIAEFQAQLSNANDTEKEELERQLEELRGSETERLQSLSDRLTRVAGEFAKLENTTQQHLLAANDAVSKLSFGTASAIGKAQAAAEQALAQARQEAAKAVGEATGNAIQSIEVAKAAATATLAQQFEEHIARLNSAADKLAAAVAAAAHSAESMRLASREPTAEPTTDAAANQDEPAAKRPRKPRRHEAADSPASAPTTSEPVEPAPAESSTAPSAPEHDRPVAATEPTPVQAEPATEDPAPEPAPVTPEKMLEVAPVAPDTAQPFDGAAAEPPEAAAPASDEPLNGAPKPTRKRAPKKPADDHPALGLELDDSAADTGRAIERVLSSDGATRLIVTAYIGIGNRLFIRGNGPGLSWDKGVPLQFVSIGKWRWETNDASAPIQFKLLKNDELEPAGLGSLTIEPGHQHEVTANF
jgi:hypothetical protein